MDMTRGDNIAVSALYTAGAWQWARLPAANLLTPDKAGSVFRFVNAYMRFYRWLNPLTYSLPHQLLHRHTAIDRLLVRADCPRVIEVACGLSPRAAEFSADPACAYIEIDLPDMIAYKRRQLEATLAGRHVLERPNLRLVEGDILDLDFASFAGPRTAVVTEGLMMYFQREQQMAIWRSIASLLARSGGTYLFDYIPLSEEPPRSRLGGLLHRLRVDVLGMKPDFAYDERNREDVSADLKACGFQRVECFNTGDIAWSWGLPQAATPSRTLIYACYTEPMENRAA